MKYLAKVVCMGLIYISGCSSEKQVSDTDFTTGAGPLRGHEDLTRFGVQWANENSSYLVFPEVSESSSGYNSDNPLVQGNYQSDFPSEEIRIFNSASSEDDWHNAGHLQNIHSLSNFNNITVESNESTCWGVQRQVTRTTELALDLYQQGDEEKAFYWLGHGMHTIQDSFSMAHADRSGDALRIIERFCTYSTELLDGCYHSSVSHDDRIWKDTLSCNYNPFDRSLDCLKPEAVLAAKASAGYLLAFDNLVANPDETVANVLEGFFEESTEYSGYLACEDLGTVESRVVDIKFVVSSLPNLSCGANYNNTGVDLNKGAGGSYVNLCVGKGRELEPITDLAIVSGDSENCPDGYEVNTTNLNDGTDGDELYLCAARGSENPIREISIIDSEDESISCPSGFTKIPENLNKGAGGQYIYICYQS